MSARQVHAVLAAGVEHPDLIERWQDQPNELRRHGVDPQAIDLAALRKFAGLTVKVRHNGLRADLPLTFRLMNVAGLEIEVFGAYASFRAANGGRYAATTAARMRDLIEFLEAWLDRSRPEHALLWDLIRHEHALAQLKRMPAPAVTEASAGVRSPEPPPSTADSAPTVRGDILLHEMQSDPRAIGEVLRQSDPPWQKVLLQPHWFCYWRPDSAEEIRILQLDAFGYCALSLVDGTRSVAELADAMGIARRSMRGFRKLLDQLAGTGILATDPDARRKPA